MYKTLVCDSISCPAAVQSTISPRLLWNIDEIPAFVAFCDNTKHLSDVSRPPLDLSDEYTARLQRLQRALFPGTGPKRSKKAPQPGNAEQEHACEINPHTWNFDFSYLLFKVCATANRKVKIGGFRRNINHTRHVHFWWLVLVHWGTILNEWLPHKALCIATHGRNVWSQSKTEIT